MLIHVKVTTGANHYKIEEKSKTSLLVSVKEPAEANKANRKMLSMVAGHFDVPTSKIKIITGHHQPGKILEIDV